MSADLSFEALGEGGSLCEGGGRPSQKLPERVYSAKNLTPRLRGEIFGLIDGDLPVRLFPPLSLNPENCEFDDKTAGKGVCRQISEPQIQSISASRI